MNARDLANRPAFALVDQWTDTPEALELVPLDRLLALKLAGYFYTHAGEARPSVSTLARRVGMSKRSVELSLARITCEPGLDGAPFIRKRGGSPKGGVRFGSTYMLNVPFLYAIARQSGLAKPTTPVPAAPASPVTTTTSETPGTDWRNPVRGLAKPRSQEDLTERSNGEIERISEPSGSHPLFLTTTTTTNVNGNVALTPTDPTTAWVVGALERRDQEPTSRRSIVAKMSGLVNAFAYEVRLLSERSTIEAYLTWKRIAREDADQTGLTARLEEVLQSGAATA